MALISRNDSQFRKGGLVARALVPSAYTSRLDVSISGDIAAGIGLTSGIGAVAGLGIGLAIGLPAIPAAIGIGTVAGAAIGAGMFAGGGAKSLISGFGLGQEKFQNIGRELYFDRFYRQSTHRLSTPTAGLSGQVAHTMRARMMQTLHNTAYHTRSVLGSEAQILHG